MTPLAEPHVIDYRARVHSAVAAWLFAALLVATGTMHFVSPSGFERIVPHVLGAAPFWVFVSGLAELGCAVALALRPSRRLGALAAVVLFVAVFPANVQMALDSGGPHPDLFHNPAVAWGRLPLQLVLIAWALYIARRAEGRN
ncbi:MAG: hypothetical protein ABI775_14815 [Pseudonocardiales bacterium]